MHFLGYVVTTEGNAKRVMLYDGSLVLISGGSVPRPGTLVEFCSPMAHHTLEALREAQRENSSYAVHEWNVPIVDEMVMRSFLFGAAMMRQDALPEELLKLLKRIAAPT